MEIKQEHDEMIQSFQKSFGEALQEIATDDLMEPRGKKAIYLKEQAKERAFGEVESAWTYYETYLSYNKSNPIRKGKERPDMSYEEKVGHYLAIAMGAEMTKVQANLRRNGAARPAPEEQDAGSYDEASRAQGITDRVWAWVVEEAQDFVPNDACLSHFAGGAPNSWAAARARLREAGYEFDKLERTHDNPGWVVTKRPEPKEQSLEEMLTGMSREDLEDVIRGLLDKME